MEIEVQVSDEPASQFDPAKLDDKGQREWDEKADDCPYEAFKGTATVTWKNANSRAACMADHQMNMKRRRRWRKVHAARMRRGGFLTHDHT